jgi:hypothetical protein
MFTKKGGDAAVLAKLGRRVYRILAVLSLLTIPLAAYFSFTGHPDSRRLRSRWLLRQRHG